MINGITEILNAKLRANLSNISISFSSRIAWVIHRPGRKSKKIDQKIIRNAFTICDSDGKRMKISASMLTHQVNINLCVIVICDIFIAIWTIKLKTYGIAHRYKLDVFLYLNSDKRHQYISYILFFLLIYSGLRWIFEFLDLTSFLISQINQNIFLLIDWEEVALITVEYRDFMLNFNNPQLGPCISDHHLIPIDLLALFCLAYLIQTALER